jgi:hypothetical protein
MRRGFPDDVVYDDFLEFGFGQVFAQHAVKVLSDYAFSPTGPELIRGQIHTKFPMFSVSTVGPWKARAASAKSWSHDRFMI